MLSYDRLSRLAGAPINTIQDRLPFLGLDIEHQEGDTVSVEYSPNRFDYSTEFGIALGLQGILGVRTGLVDMRVGASVCDMVSDESVRDVRPAITGILAKDHDLDDHTIRQIISMQEDLHQGPGRRRKKLAIGIHDADKISFPLKYTTVDRDFEFAPLNCTDEIPIHRILKETEQGTQYGGLIQDCDAIPIILDKDGIVASMPPIINSNYTTVTESTKNLFVDVTGMMQHDVEGALGIIAVTLQTAGYTLQRVNISGGTNRTPPLQNRQVSFDYTVSNSILGLNMDIHDTVQCIRRARLGADTDENDDKKIICVIPPYRTDIFGMMDIVEEVSLGYGIDRMTPTLPGVGTYGRTDDTDVIHRVMIGLGYTQVMNSCLSSADILARGGSAPKISVADSKSQSHTTLRGALLPGLMENLSHNIHEPYPHKLYECGVVFGADGNNGTVHESAHLACVVAYKNATYSEAKSVLHAALRHGMGMGITTPPYNVSPYEIGRSASVVYNGTRHIGHIGEISKECRQAFKIRDDISVAGWEVELIFDDVIQETAP